MENLGGLVPMALNSFLGGLKSSSLARPQDQQQASSDLPGFASIWSNQQQLEMQGNKFLVVSVAFFVTFIDS